LRSPSCCCSTVIKANVGLGKRVEDGGMGNSKKEEAGVNSVANQQELGIRVS
jgi:hypothetical protein